MQIAPCLSDHLSALPVISVFCIFPSSMECFTRANSSLPACAEDRICLVHSWRPVTAGGKVVEDGVERSYVGMFDGCAWDHMGSVKSCVSDATAHTCPPSWTMLPQFQ